MKYNRVFVVVIDSLGVGALPDAADYGDVGTDTLGNIAKAVGGLKIPNLVNLGIANLHQIPNVAPIANPMGYAQYLHEMSVGKDTLTGHWEMMGVHTTQPFKVFTDTGFPEELIQLIEEKTGREVVGNKSASGTEILDEFARDEIDNGKIIVYTSADSVLQICGDENTMGVEKLYEYCEYAREITMKDEWRVARIIARPYVADGDTFVRTSNRHDYALSPPHATCLDVLKDKGLDVISIGKIADIFNNNGITEGFKSKSSVHGMEQTIDVLDMDFKGLCFTNLVDFDALWGHRRNPEGYAKELEMFDEKLGIFLEKMKEDDLLIITADHGNDPTHVGSDHTRERVFMLSYAKNMEAHGVLPHTESFGTIGATVLDNFNIEKPVDCIGESVLSQFK